MLQVSVQSEGGARKGQLDPEGSVSDPLLRRQESLCGIHPPGEASEHFISLNLSKSSPCAGLVCEQDCVVRAGLHAAEAGRQGVWVEPQLRRHRSHVEGRLYHQEQVNLLSSTFSQNIFPRFLGNIKAAFDKNPSLDNLLLDDFFRDAIHNCQV